jgi:hypothetical protein
MTKCEQRGGHQFHATPASGWFQCGQLAVCPACLGFAYSCLPVLFCEVHQSCRLEDFDVIACMDDTASGGVEHVAHEQASLW